MHNMAFLKFPTSCRGLQKSCNNTHWHASPVLYLPFSHMHNAYQCIACPHINLLMANGIVLKHKIAIVSTHYNFRGHDESIMWLRIGTYWSGLWDMVQGEATNSSPSTILSLYLYDQPTTNSWLARHDPWSLLEVASLADVHSLASLTCSRVNIVKT